MFLLGELTEIAPMEDLSENIGALQQFLNTLPEKALGLGYRVLIAAVLYFIGAKLIKFIRKFLKKSLEKANVELGVIQFLDGLIKILLYFVLILLVASNFGFDATSMVALLGSAGIAVGLALQGSLSNLAGGVLILLLKPFRVGDYIKEDGGANEGTVKEIGIFYTKLTTNDGKTVVLPNGSLANNSLTNASDVNMRRVDLQIGISYNADIKKAKAVLKDVLNNENDISEKEKNMVFVDSLGPSEVVIGVRCFCAKEKYWDIRWRLLENIKYALDDAEIEIPYQQVDVHMK